MGDSGVARLWSVMNPWRVILNNISYLNHGHTIVPNMYPAKSGDGWAGVPYNPDARDWTGKTRSLLAKLTMQDRIIPCQHDFILRLRLDMQMGYIFRLMDQAASNMMLTSLARENVCLK